MNDEKNKKPGRYETLVAAVEADGPLEVSVLASSSFPSQGRWMLIEGEDEAHYLSPDDILSNEEAREWPVFVSVVRIR
jgi:hypothetical protein